MEMAFFFFSCYIAVKFGLIYDSFLLDLSYM